MLFYDTECMCFRKVFIAMNGNEPYLSGWGYYAKPSELL